MEQTPPASSEPPPLPPPTTSPPLTTSSSTASPEQPHQSQSQPLSTTTTSSLQPPPPSVNPSPKLTNPPVSQPLQSQSVNPILRTPFNRPWQQSPPPFPHFSSITNHSTAPSLTSILPSQRGGMAIGVPAHGPSPQPPSSFSSLTPPAFGSQFGGLGRPSSLNVPESVTSTSTAQV